jgi:hypothetical protein
VENLVISFLAMFVGALMSPMTWLIALIVGMFFDSLLAIVVICFLLRGGLGWIMWMGMMTATNTESARSMPQQETAEPIFIMLLYLIPQVAAIFLIAVITRAIRHAAGYGSHRG